MALTAMVGILMDIGLQDSPRTSLQKMLPPSVPAYTRNGSAGSQSIATTMSLSDPTDSTRCQLAAQLLDR